MSFNISIDHKSFNDTLATIESLKMNLPTIAASVITATVEQTRDQVVYETVAVLNVDDGRVESEISVTPSASGTIKDYKSTIVSKGKPIEMITLSEDAENWKWRKPTPVHARIYRQGATHEFRHVFVSKGHIYGRKQHGVGGESPGLVFGWMKYAAKDKALRYPIEILQTVRVQDIQANPEFIDSAIKIGADAAVSDFEGAIDEVFSNA